MGLLVCKMHHAPYDVSPVCVNILLWPAEYCDSIERLVISAYV